ncbi:MAG: protoglobin domain-containing protein, partial [Gallionella sp.]|nr:protoglobin domain-containing protein [Gallionella sp.]
MRDIPALLAEIGIDENEIARRQAFLSFGESDTALLKSMHAMLETHREHLTEVFYEHLLQFPEIRPLLGDEAKLARLKHAQAVYFGQLTSGSYDLPYVENRLHIGVVHQRVGLTPKWYMSAYCKYLSEVMPLVLDHYADDPERGQAASAALLKVVFFDMGLALDTYFHAEHKALLLARNYTEQIVSNMPIGFIVLDARGNIRLANNAVLRMFDLAGNTSWSGKTLGEFLDVALLNEEIIRVLASGTHCNDFGFERTNEDGVRSYLADISLAQIGEEHVVLFMVQDVTLRKQSEEEI